MFLFKDNIKNCAGNKRFICWSLISFLMLIIVVETALLFVQQNINRQIEAQSEQALEKFLKQGPPISSKTENTVLMQNVRFCWSSKICINSPMLSGSIYSLNGAEINYDNIKSFIVNVHQANVLISPKTLEGMFNESVFNYPGSRLRGLSVGITQTSPQNHVKLSGSLKYVLWVPFTMDTDLRVDQKTNTLVISVNTLRIFGFIPATWLLHISPFHIERLLTLPSNKHLTIHGNEIMVKPFGLFPPPRIGGKMRSITVTKEMIVLRFTGKKIAFNHLPSIKAKNYIYLQGGRSQFGPFIMSNTNIQVIDNSFKSLFKFSLSNYWQIVHSGTLKINPDNSVILITDAK